MAMVAELAVRIGTIQPGGTIVIGTLAAVEEKISHMREVMRGQGRDSVRERLDYAVGRIRMATTRDDDAAQLGVSAAAAAKPTSTVVAGPVPKHHRARSSRSRIGPCPRRRSRPVRAAPTLVSRATRSHAQPAARQCCRPRRQLRPSRLARPAASWIG